MKKYIRSKDKIYEFVDYDEEYFLPYPIVKYKGKLTHCLVPDIINHADTIEELCDEFVCGENHLLLKLYELKSEDFKEDVKDIVYGAIWTDKGLIYVAKMNEKGELELL